MLFDVLYHFFRQHPSRFSTFVLIEYDVPFFLDEKALRKGSPECIEGVLRVSSMEMIGGSRRNYTCSGIVIVIILQDASDGFGDLWSVVFQGHQAKKARERLTHTKRCTNEEMVRNMVMGNLDVLQLIAERGNKKTNIHAL
jgi:hypothetical protein